MTAPIYDSAPVPPRLIAWEVTRTCHLECQHCRGVATPERYEDELTTDECLRLLDHIAAFAEPTIILTGGEPMLRPDIFEIARHSAGLGLRTVLATCGTFVNDQSVPKMIDAGIQCISISLDGATPHTHDVFRRIPGAFDNALDGIAAAKRGHLPFQINTTVTRDNLGELPDIMNLAEELGAVTFNVFLLVPIGRSAELAHREISPQQYEQTLRWLNAQQERTRMQIRVTCAPHYQRIVLQDRAADRRRFCGVAPPGATVPAETDRRQRAPAHGCLGGKTFAFISHTGKVQMCGFHAAEAGDLKQVDYDFAAIWSDSPLFRQVRDVDHYHGKCGQCDYRRLCGGCRARAYAMTGDLLGPEPFCIYEPNIRWSQSG